MFRVVECTPIITATQRTALRVHYTYEENNNVYSKLFYSLEELFSWYSREQEHLSTLEGT